MAIDQVVDSTPRIETASSLGRWRGAWDALVRAAPQPTPFASSWWVETVEGEGARCLLLVLEGEELIGGLALRRRRRMGLDTFELLGAQHAAPDHVDLLARAGSEAAVCGAVGRWFDDQGTFVLRADGVPEGSLLARALDGRASIVPFTTAPYLPLDGDEAPGPTSSRVRNTAERSRRRLGREQELTHRRVDEPGAPFDRALAELERLHRTRWVDGSNFTAGLPRLAPALHAGVAAGAVAIHELAVDDRVVASMLVIELPDRCCYYQSGREVAREFRGAGTVLMQDVIQHAHARGMREFDFLRGSERYKLDWTDRERALHLLVAGGGRRGQAARRSLAGLQRAKPLLRRARERARRARRALPSRR